MAWPILRLYIQHCGRKLSNLCWKSLHKICLSRVRIVKVRKEANIHIRAKKLYIFCLYQQASFPSCPIQKIFLYINLGLFADFGRICRKNGVCFPQERAPPSAMNTFFLRIARRGCPHSPDFLFHSGKISSGWTKNESGREDSRDFWLT